MSRKLPYRTSHLRQVEHLCLIWCFTAQVKAADNVAKVAGRWVHILQLLDAGMLVELQLQRPLGCQQRLQGTAQRCIYSPFTGQEDA